MAAKFIRKTQGPPIIKAANSNAISDAYRDAITISYQYINGVAPSCDFTLNGRTYETPIMAGPIGVPKNDKMLTMVDYAKAVTEAGSVYWANYHAPDEWDALLKEGCTALRVIKPLADIDRFIEEVKKDADRGAVGYAMDIDHGMTAYGEFDGQAEPFAPKTVDDLRRISEASSLPFYLKGILSVHDALLAKEAGVSGFVISGHNNRFPCTVPPLKILPELRKAVGKDMAIFVDGGMNTGFDAFKALALGADGVLSARALCGAFAQDGPEGLTYKLLEMTAELKGAMANTGSPDLAHINTGSIILP